MADEVESTQETAAPESPVAEKLVFDGGHLGGIPTNSAIRAKYPMGRVHTHFNRRADGYVYRDNHETRPMFFPNPAEPTKALYAGEEIDG